MSVKGLELPAFDPRGMAGQGLAFATSNRGGCHTRANMLGHEIIGVPERLDRFATAGKARPVIALQDLNAALDSLVGCKFAAFAVTPDAFARLLGAMLGEPVETDELLRAGERIWNAERLFNLRAGFTRADDTLPARLLHEPVAAGPCAGHVVDLEPMLEEYYRNRGWDERGVPTAASWPSCPVVDGPPPGEVVAVPPCPRVKRRAAGPEPGAARQISVMPTEGESSTCTES